MPPPHETLFFLTGGTGPRPTQAVFLAAAAQRTAKTAEVRRKREMRKEEGREQQVRRERVLREVPGVGVGIMRFLGLRGVRKGRGVGGGQVEKNGEASGGGGGDAGKDAGGTSKEDLAKDAASSKELEKEAVENDIIQSAGYDAGILPEGETCAGTHHGTPLINFDGAGDDGHIIIGKSSNTQDGEVEMLLDADEVIASTPRLLDSDKDDGEKSATADDIKSVASNGTHNSPSQEGQSIHESVHSHIPNTPPVMPVPMELKVGSGINLDGIGPPILVLAPNPNVTVEDSCGQEPNILQVPPKDAQPDLGSEINPDDIHQPIIVRALDPDDSLDRNHNDESLSLPVILKNALPESESDINPDDIKPPIIVPAPDPDDSSGPIPSNNTLPGLERDINLDDIRPPILVPAPDLDDSAEGNLPKDTPAELESSINPDDTQPPIIVLVPDSDDNANDSLNPPPEIPPNLSASLTSQDAELDVQIQHDVRDPFSPTPHLPPPWETANIPYPHDENYIFSPTPQLARPWERPDETFQAIQSSPLPQLGLIAPSEASESPQPSRPTPSPVPVEFRQRNTPSPHLDLPTPSSFFIHESSSRATSRASSVRNSIVEKSLASLAAFEYDAPGAHLIPLPTSRKSSIADSVRSVRTRTPLNGVGTEQNISQPLPSRERAQQTIKWVRSGGGGWSREWVRVME